MTKTAEIAEPEVIETGLIEFKRVEILAAFTGDSIKELLRRIEAEVEGVEPDTSTAKSRKEIASLAYKVSQSKTVLDGLGKKLVEGWKAQSKQVDASRKEARDFLDELRDRTRKPLNDWEEAEAAKIEAARISVELIAHEIEAHAENALFDRQRDIERKEAELAEKEAARVSAEQEAAQEADRVAREETIRKEAHFQAIQKAEAEAQAERDASARRIQEEADRANRAEAERIAGEQRAERERIASAERYRIEQEQALQRERDDVAARERSRIDNEAAEKAVADQLSADKDYRKKINNEVLADLIAGGIEEQQAKMIIRFAATGKIRHLEISY